MRKFELNGKVYSAKAFDFNMVCDLEDLGFSMEEINKKKIKAVRAYAALCAGITIEEAGIEIQKHIIEGGDISEMMEIMVDEINKSDFFRALQTDAEKEDTENQEEAK